MNRKNPTLYQVNTRVFLTEIGHRLNRPATLDDIPKEEIENWSQAGFDWIWMLSVWQTGEAGRGISRENPIWRKEYEETLPDLQEEDIAGSGFAITGYTVSEKIGGEDALLRFRDRLAGYGMKLMLDFVPNHMAPDHPWIDEHPDYFIRGTEKDLERAPGNYARVKRKHDELILAYGRDPYFPGWPDTVQLNYGNSHLQKAMSDELTNIATKCDGVRCDMAMLLLPEVFQKTWGIDTEPFWPVVIRQVKEQYPDFILMGEVYWDMEWTMQQQGFDYTYDKRLYDRLLALEATPVREHLLAGLDYQERLGRFLENHDEQRIASVFPWDVHQAAAVITFLTPGLKFFHQGEIKGWKKKVSPHLGRGPDEDTNPGIEAFYKRLIEIINRHVLHEGEWMLLTCHRAWEGNPSYGNFIAFSWKHDGTILLVVVNYADHQGQSLVQLPFYELSDQTCKLSGIMHHEAYELDGNDLINRGLFVDLPAWGFHVFDIS